MAYRRSYSHSHLDRPRRPSASSSRQGVVLFAFLAGCFVVFIGSMLLFRSRSRVAEEPIESSLQEQSQTFVAPSAALPLRALMHLTQEDRPIGAVTRSFPAGGVPQVSIVLTLPEIDRTTQFYEAWLVQSIPYDFFSVGELLTNDLGEFVLDWGGALEKDISGYTEVVITLQQRDGNLNPGAHVAVGEFSE